SEFIIEQVFLDNQNIDARCGSLDAYDLPREVQNYLGEWARKFLLNRKTINKRIDFKKDPFRGQFIAKKLKE
ncbi:hypothetical protein, partial [Pseudoalteromonas sp. 5-MNA-CIBAN-0065]|uniref:hypothetical protein n=1 Tax=Pseudoalteromonas sp. 5-MNA-CIBAN-0065 TaxID=3140421 RepID=UPI003321BBC4